MTRPDSGSAGESRPGKTYRVLMADDSEQFRRMFSTLVEDSPLLELVALAENGTEALSLGVELAPDVMVLDVEMPDLTGFDVARRLGERSPSIKYVIVSARDEAEYRRMAMEIGAVAFIPKARLSGAELVKVLQEAERPR